MRRPFSLGARCPRAARHRRLHPLGQRLARPPPSPASPPPPATPPPAPSLLPTVASPRTHAAATSAASPPSGTCDRSPRISRLHRPPPRLGRHLRARHTTRWRQRPACARAKPRAGGAGGRSHDAAAPVPGVIQAMALPPPPAAPPEGSPAAPRATRQAAPSDAGHYGPRGKGRRPPPPFGGCPRATVAALRLARPGRKRRQGRGAKRAFTRPWNSATRMSLPV